MGSVDNKPAALTQADILGILQDAHSVTLGQPIFNSSEEYNKLKAIIESAIRYFRSTKTLTDEEIHQIFRDESGFEIDTCPIAILDFARAILKKVSEK